VTYGLIAVNVIVYFAEAAQGIGLRGTRGSSVIGDGAVYGPAIADGEWWRLLTAGFIHAGLVHLAFNMIALWWLGPALEGYLGSLRMSAIYLSSLLWGSAGALIASADARTVGASGGVYGLMAALLVIQRQRGMALLGSGVGALLGVNLVITFLVPGISIGGHLGGLVGGAAAAYALSAFGRGHVAYGRMGAPVAASVVALLVAAVGVSLAVV
jgi:membrane associated rhomboid family serine protease